MHKGLRYGPLSHGHARYDKGEKELPRSLRYTRSQRATEEQVMRIALAFSDHEQALKGASGKLQARRARSCERMLLYHYQYYQVQNPRSCSRASEDPPLLIMQVTWITRHRSDPPASVQPAFRAPATIPTLPQKTATPSFPFRTRFLCLCILYADFR